MVAANEIVGVDPLVNDVGEKFPSANVLGAETLNAQFAVAVLPNISVSANVALTVPALNNGLGR